MRKHPTTTFSAGTTKKKPIKTSQNTSNRTSISSSAYQQIKCVVQRILNNKKHPPTTGNPKKSQQQQPQQQQAQTKPCIHQPIMNNFIVVNNNYHPFEEGGMETGGSSKVKNSVNKRMFGYRYIIGKGGFGKVWKVTHNKSKKQYALKEMLKSIVLAKKSVNSILNEQKLLLTLYSPFLVNMHYAFQDRETLWRSKTSPQHPRILINPSQYIISEIEFLIACIVLGLEYLHSNNIIHRDIKPENLVLDSKGYLRITDLGISRIFRAENSSDTSGTPGYMSPEVICRKNHGFVSDYFALGVIAHEFITGKRPYNGYSRQQIRENILSKQAQIRLADVTKYWSGQGIDFANQLIQRRPDKRLGYSGINEIKQHPWLREINWDKISRKELESPFIPYMKKTDFDQDEKITIEDEDQEQLIKKNSLLLRKEEIQKMFNEYSYSRESVEIKSKIGEYFPSRGISGSMNSRTNQRSHRLKTSNTIDLDNRSSKFTQFLKDTMRL